MKRRAKSSVDATRANKRRKLANGIAESATQRRLNSAEPVPSEQLEETAPVLVWMRIMDFVEKDPVSALKMARSCAYFRDLFLERSQSAPSCQALGVITHEVSRIASGKNLAWTWEFRKHSQTWTDKNEDDNLWSTIIYEFFKSENSSVDTIEAVPDIVQHITEIAKEQHEPWMFALWSRVALFLRSVSYFQRLDVVQSVTCVSCGRFDNMLLSRFAPCGLRKKGVRSKCDDPVTGHVAVPKTRQTVAVTVCKDCIDIAPFGGCKYKFGTEKSDPGFEREVKWFKPVVTQRGKDPFFSYSVLRPQNIGRDTLDNYAWALPAASKAIQGRCAQFTTALKSLSGTMRGFGVCDSFVVKTEGKFVKQAKYDMHHDVCCVQTPGIHKKLDVVAKITTRACNFEREIRQLAEIVAKGRISTSELFFLGHNRKCMPWTGFLNEPRSSLPSELTRRTRRVKGAHTDVAGALDIVFGTMSNKVRPVLETAVEMLVDRGLFDEFMQKFRQLD